MPLLRKGQKARTPAALRALAPGVSMRTLSRRSGIAASHLSRIINGRRGLTVRVAALIALHTGQTLDRVVSVLHVNGHKPRKRAA